MRRALTFFGFFILFVLSSVAQKTTTNGPKTEIGDDPRLALMSVDDRYLFFCSTDKGFNGSYDDMYITVYDKEKSSVVIEHEIDEDLLFRTAYMQGNNVVLMGSKYNNKTKSVEYFQCSFPVMGKTPRKFIKTVTYSVPAENSILVFAEIVWSPDHTKMAFVTYTRPKNSKTKSYSIDVKVCSTDGTELMKAHRQQDGIWPMGKTIFLTNNATAYVIEERTISKFDENPKEELGLEIKTKDHIYRYLTITSSGEFAPPVYSDIQMIKPISALTPKGDLYLFSETPSGVTTLEIDQQGEILWQYSFDTEFPKEPEGITYEDREEGLRFVPIQVLPLSDGRTIVSGTQYKRHVESGDHIYVYYVNQSLILFLFDNNGEMSTQVLPFSYLSWDLQLSTDVPLIEWEGNAWIMYNGHKNNYGPKKSSKWETPDKHQKYCIAIIKIDDDLNFESSALYVPPKDNIGNECFMRIMHVSEDAVYYLKHYNGDNRIEKITK